ncbi:TonB-dependent siderophore receptor [Parvibaculum sp.]|uniref:TonB-dependent receptor plug domain-containing protein n=1 Tax=Parvibaculum sp. TaxID=2024848 RepID=UPI0025F70F1E|nr:TonB-dependent receptor plug domain-containing protein [Parvibaculum sp.]
MAMITGRRSLLSLLLATASLAAISTAQAQDTASSEEDAKPRATQLDAVTSTATRNPTPIKDVAGTVSVITAEELERRNAHTMQDIVRYEPGVSVGYAPNRGGSTNFTIRGIGGNRVLVLVDGLNTPDFPGTNIGSPSSYTRDFFDIDSMKSIEIVRGPASALYGSDGLGGIVAYETKDPADYLDGLDKDWYASIKGGYASAELLGIADGRKACGQCRDARPLHAPRRPRDRAEQQRNAEPDRLVFQCLPRQARLQRALGQLAQIHGRVQRTQRRHQPSQRSRHFLRHNDALLAG